MGTEANSELIDQIVEHLRARGGRSTADRVCREILGLANCDPAVAAAILGRGLVRDGRLEIQPDGAVLLKSRKAVDPLLSRLRYAVIDLETTGLPQPNHRITEVAAVLVERGKVTDDFSTLVNPGIEIPRRIVKMTGITNEMVADAPTFDEVADPLVELLGRRVLVAHNGTFDINFLNGELDRCRGTRLVNTTLCTVKMARKLAPGLDSYRLGAVAEYFGIGIEDRHRALGDAAATAEVFIRLLDLAVDEDIERLSQLHKIAGVKVNGSEEDSSKPTRNREPRNENRNSRKSD